MDERSKWRWLGVVPIAIIGQIVTQCLLFVVIQVVVSGLRAWVNGPPSTFTNMTTGIWAAVCASVGVAAFIVCGAAFAPRYLFRTAIVLLGLYVAIFHLCFVPSPYFASLTLTKIVVGGVIGVSIVAIQNLEIPISIYAIFASRSHARLDHLKSSISKRVASEEIAEEALSQLTCCDEAIEHDLSLLEFRSHDRYGIEAIQSRWFHIKWYISLERKVAKLLKEQV